MGCAWPRAGLNYAASAVRARDGAGRCTAIGHSTLHDADGAAFLNGTVAHGEDFDDTFEGTPVHPGSVVVLAVLAACEADSRSSCDMLKGIGIGAERMCRMAVVVPTGVVGTFGAALGVGAALGLDRSALCNALGVTDPNVPGLAAKITYRIDPKNDCPRTYSGHLCVVMHDGTVVEHTQPHLHGGR